MGTPQPLAQPFAPVTLVGGGGTASIGPTVARQHWQVTSVSVNVATNASEALCKLYVGSTLGTATFLSATRSGSTGDVCGMGGMDIQPGMKLWAVWTGGDSGSVATMTVNGTYSNGPPD